MFQLILKWQNEVLLWKKSGFLVDLNLHNLGRNSKDFLGVTVPQRHPSGSFFQSCARCVRNSSFSTMPSSPLWWCLHLFGDDCVTTPSCRQVCCDLEAEEACLWGLCYWTCSCQGCDICCRPRQLFVPRSPMLHAGCASVTFCFTCLSFHRVFEIQPNCQREASLPPRPCVFPLSPLR
jgi:hypothetical protein